MSAIGQLDAMTLDCPDPQSLAAADRLARLGGGVSQPVRTLAEIPAALTRLLAAR